MPRRGSSRQHARTAASTPPTPAGPSRTRTRYWPRRTPSSARRQRRQPRRSACAGHLSPLSPSAPSCTRSSPWTIVASRWDAPSSGPIRAACHLRTRSNASTTRTASTPAPAAPCIRCTRRPSCAGTVPTKPTFSGKRLDSSRSKSTSKPTGWVPFLWTTRWPPVAGCWTCPPASGMPSRWRPPASAPSGWPHSWTPRRSSGPSPRRPPSAWDWRRAALSSPAPGTAPSPRWAPAASSRGNIRRWWRPAAPCVP